MARQTIGVGSAPNDGTGDPLRVGGIKLNDMTLELYRSVRFASGTVDAIAGPPVASRLFGTDPVTAQPVLVGYPSVTISDVPEFTSYAQVAATTIIGAGSAVTYIRILGRLVAGDFGGWMPATYSAVAPTTHAGFVQSADGAYWIFAPLIATEAMFATADATAQFGYATNRPVMLLVNDGNITINPQTGTSTDVERNAVIANAVIWAGKNLYGNNCGLTINIAGTDAIGVFGQILVNDYGNIGWSGTPIRLQMPAPVSVNISAIQFESAISGATVVAAPKYGGITHCSASTVGTGLTGSSTALVIDPVTSVTAVAGFAGTAHIAAGSITGVVVTNRGTGATSSDVIDFDWTAAGQAPAHVTLNIIGGAVDSVTVDDPGSGFTSAPTITIREPTTRAQGSLNASLTCVLAGDTLASVTVNSGGTNYTTPVGVVVGGGHPVVTAQINMHINPVVVTYASAIPANVAAGMPIGHGLVRGDNDAGAINGAAIVTGVDLVNNRVGFDWTTYAGTMTDPTALTGGNTVFPTCWLSINGGYTGLNIEGYIDIGQGGRLQTQTIHAVWNMQTATNQATKASQKFISSGIGGGDYHNFSGPSIIAGFPEQFYRGIHVQSAYLNNMRCGGSPYGGVGFTVQFGGSAQITQLFVGGQKGFGVLCGDGNEIYMSSSIVGSCGVGISSQGGDLNFQASEIQSCFDGVEALYLGNCVGLGTGKVNRCVNALTWDGGGTVIIDDFNVTNTRGIVSPSPADTASKAGGWINNYVATLVKAKRFYNSDCKVGNTAGWVVGGTGSDAAIGRLATLPASQTGSTLIVPISGLQVGDSIITWSLVGQIDSAGNTVTLDAQLWRLTAVPTGLTAAQVLPSMTAISVTADTQMSENATTATNVDTLTTVDNSVAAGIQPEIVGEAETFYLLLTGTTGATTEIRLSGVHVEIGR